ncbi:hypothetical protein F8M41_017307 [Gigaspora margarita]|uniref:F-box domain-containing protein n=1 Tax=Gigaspora margarita TaxID=4874 RepID=A0A8H4ANE5_GIGMA|nr:hypothetical protein F8M41_017307 [Gigaspora margarita]
MIALPPESYSMIFHNLRQDYKSLLSCVRVNRHWCRIAIPILWSEPGPHFRKPKFIGNLLLKLNAEEQALLIPFKITLPKQQKKKPTPLFDYISYITSITEEFYEGVEKWLPYRYGLNKWQPLGIDEMSDLYELVDAVKCSLLIKLLRSIKSLKCLYLDKVICNQSLFEILYEKTTVTSLCLLDLDEDFKYRTKAVDVLSRIFNMNPTLTSLNLKSVRLEAREIKTLFKTLNKNLSFLCLYETKIDTEEKWITIADYLCENTTLTFLDLSYQKEEEN